MLGDCLLHRDHHEMEAACWATIIDYALTLRRAGKTESEMADVYKWDYEQQLLTDLIRASADPL